MGEKTAITNSRLLLLTLLMAVVIWLPRGLVLDRFVTADEHAWLARSANFYRALHLGEFAETFQRHHPGVTVTWAGMLGFLTHYPGYAADAPQYFGWLSEEVEPFLREQGYDPVDLLAAGRSFAVLFITLTLALAFWISVRLFGLWPALAGFSLIAFDPFHIGLSRLMHLDGLLSSFMLLALLAYLCHLHTRRRSYLVLSAVAAGFAWLTRSPGLFLIPFIIMVEVGLTIFDLRTNRTRRDAGDSSFVNFKSKIVNVFLWLLLAALTFFLFWPAMWVDPLDSVGQVLGAASSYAAEGHLKPIFFNGEIYSGDPGLIFYPLAYLWRTTPVTLIGLLLAVAVLFRPAQSTPGKRFRIVILILLLYALLFGVFMNLGAKKFDRYLLPIFPVLNLVAGIGYVHAFMWIWDLRTRIRSDFNRQDSLIFRQSVLISGFVLILIVTQASLALATFPYYLTFYNPLAGGSERAQDVMQIGWGEGADQAARLLATEENSDELVVASAYTNGPFSYFFPGETLAIYFWHQADYAVLYAQDFQRRLPSPRQIRYFEELVPTGVVSLEDLDYAKIYDVRNSQLPTYVTEWQDMEGNRPVRLVSYQLPSSILTPNESVPLTLYFAGQSPTENNLNVIVRLIDSQGNQIAREEGWPWGAATSSWIPGDVWPDGHSLSIPNDVDAGAYRVDVAFYDPVKGEQLTAIQTVSGEELGAWLPLDFVTIGYVPQEPTIELEPVAGYGEIADLVGLSMTDPAQVDASSATIMASSGETITLELHWLPRQTTDVNYTIFTHVVGSDGEMLVQNDGQPQSGFYPTSFWQRDRPVNDPISLTIPQAAMPGTYTIYVGMYELSTGQRLSVERNGMIIGDALPVATLIVESNP